MANREHLAKIKEGVEAWNAWRRANLEIVPDLSDAILLIANLREANLGGANLGGASLGEAHLERANLCGANLEFAQLLGTKLRDADLRMVNFHTTNLGSAELSGADLSGAYIGYSTFGDNDLSDVKGLEAVQHHGPSTIGIDTIYRSKGKIPEAFLRGAGVPDNFIEYMGSPHREGP